ncbi:MAG TPA: DEAD/DEAH box helicase [Ignavibacteria bacterium]|nr:DEAD/DEAH box helicase [Ignavibacteria bacterium]HMR39759.1 DEAD/DEAH box helicase [Ignavibacteria bacterium]
MYTLKFEELGLSKDILNAITDMGFEEATPIQSQAIPVILSGKDVIGQAQTGTGKTASFGIPIIETIDFSSKKVQAIVLCPTRELAIQVSEELSELLKYKKNAKIVPIYGGQPIDRQIRSINSGVQIVIGTPGRVIDHINRATLKLKEIKMVVLDEADEMLDMGFRDDIEMILKQVPEERQTILFSATMPKQILDLSKKYLTTPDHIKVVHKEVTVPNVNQYYIELKPSMKLEVLTRLIDIHNPKLSLVFSNRKRSVDDLVSHLQARGYSAEGLHGDLKQTMRDRVMSKFRSGKLEILVATDVAARGIDVDDIDAVFNYDMPQDDEYYVHRIGRTARAGRAGQAFTFVVGKEFRTIKEIERYTKTKIISLPIPSMKDVQEIRTNTLINEIKALMDSDDDMTKYSSVIDRLVNEDYTSVEIAAALLKMVMGKEKEEAPAAEYTYERENFSRDDRGDRKDRGDRGDRGGRFKKKGKFDKGGKHDGGDSRGSFKRGGDENMVRLFINVGKNQRVKPNDIVGAIAGESGIPGKAIGEIAIFDKYSFVEIPKQYSDKVIKVMDNNTIKGKQIAMEIASERKY